MQPHLLLTPLPQEPQQGLFVVSHPTRVKVVLLMHVYCKGMAKPFSLSVFTDSLESAAADGEAKIKL